MRASKNSTSTEVRCWSPAGSTMPCPFSMVATCAKPACASRDSWLGGVGTPAAGPLGSSQPAQAPMRRCERASERLEKLLSAAVRLPSMKAEQVHTAMTHLIKTSLSCPASQCKLALCCFDCWHVAVTSVCPD